MTYGKYEITLSKNNGSYVARWTNIETREGDELSLSSQALLLKALQSNLDLDGMDVSDLREDIQSL